MLRHDNLAFSSPRPAVVDDEECTNFDANNSLIRAIARTSLAFDKDTTLNVELFGPGWNTGNVNGTIRTPTRCRNLLCFVPGVCESAETWTVQHLARACQESNKEWSLAVLELEGHGLSSGPRGLLQPSGKAGLKRLVDQVVAFCHHVVVDVMFAKSTTTTMSINVVLVGMSLGGTLAVYAAPRIAKDMPKDVDGVTFGGCLLLSPAVGVAPHAVPPPIIVIALSCLAFVAPSSSLLTPEEDPSHYACPPWSSRNFSGQWPLGTSKLLLDITSVIVPGDVADAKKGQKQNNHGDTNANVTFCPHDGYSYKVLVLAGLKDPVVPVDMVRNFVSALNGTQNPPQPNTTTATLIEIPNGGHGLLANQKSNLVDATLGHIKDFLNQ